MNHLTRNDYAAALRLLVRIEAQADDVDRFARATVMALNGYVASEFTTLSVCDLRTGHCQVVRLHGRNGGRFTQRMSDALGRGAAQRSEPYADYCRRIGLEYAMAVPLCHDGNIRVSMVLNRRKLDFSERDRERLELLRPHLAFLYDHACRGAAHATAGPPAPPLMPPLRDPAPSGLTARECDVLQWLACGKTDADIAALLSISPRTVHKHLEHIYVKLGVETRTAAVMRFLAVRESRAVTAA